MLLFIVHDKVCQRKEYPILKINMPTSRGVEQREILIQTIQKLPSSKEQVQVGDGNILSVVHAKFWSIIPNYYILFCFDLIFAWNCGQPIKMLVECFNQLVTLDSCLLLQH